MENRTPKSPLHTLLGRVVIRPVLRDRTEREIAFLETDDGKAYELIFVSEHPYLLDITKKYADKYILCKGTFWSRRPGTPVFFSKFYKRVKPTVPGTKRNVILEEAESL